MNNIQPWCISRQLWWGHRIPAWYSTDKKIFVGLGGALYPQAIQRIYAARNPRTLRWSLAVMAFLPLTTTLVVLLVGIIAAGQGLEVEKPIHLLPAIC